jgi:hypothetical protein
MPIALDRTAPAGAKSLTAFEAAYPAFDGAAVAALRAREYARLDAGDRARAAHRGGGRR